MELLSISVAPTTSSVPTKQDYFDLLPPIAQAQSQIFLTYLLGSVYYTTLGQYPNFEDMRVQLPLKQFQLHLQVTEENIKTRLDSLEGQKEPIYPYLLPSKIPQSFNI